MSTRTTAQAQPANQLLQCLTRSDRQRLIAECEEIDLVESQVLCEPGDRISHVHFPLGGFISQITPIEQTAGFEVGLVGREGMQGIALALGVSIAPQRSLVQGAGTALRMPAAAFLREHARSASLRRVLDRYLYVLLCQLAQTGACTRFHLLEPRLARWLLMSHDRTIGDTFHLTHEFLAFMLGMRRVGITVAAGALQKMDLISYARGTITIRDRSGLEAAACACYRIDRESYARLLTC